MANVFGYIYVTTNKINGKVYIGQKYSPDGIKVNSYLGSGMYLLRAIKKYGKKNFTNEIIEWCETSDELNEREIYWIKEYGSTNSDIGYNLSDGGHVPRMSGPNNYMYGRTHSPEVIEFLRKNSTGRVFSEESRKKMSMAHRGGGNARAIKYLMRDVFDNYFIIDYGNMVCDIMKTNKNCLRKNTKDKCVYYKNGFYAMRYLTDSSYEDNVFAINNGLEIEKEQNPSRRCVAKIHNEFLHFETMISLSNYFNLNYHIVKGAIYNDRKNGVWGFEGLEIMSYERCLERYPKFKEDVYYVFL